MPRVDLTDYEIAHDLLPAVCAKCGEPAVERVVHTIRVLLDGWRGMVQLFGVLFGLFFFPPLLVYTLRHARPIEVRVPLCAAHRDRYRWQDWAEHRVLLPVWTVAAVLMDVVLVIDMATNFLGFACIGTWVVLIGAVIASGAIGRGRVLVGKPGKTGLRLMDAHTAFVAAIQEDRARDRVSNPDRRGGFGDVRDDYDDEPG
jgi:hypothetical protein